MPRRLSLLLTLLIVPGPLIAGQQSAVQGLSLGEVLGRVGAAVERYYARAQSVMCLETVALQTLTTSLTADDSFPRRLVYELRVAWEPPDGETIPEARVQRELIRVNNRSPRPKDKPGCTDPTPVSPDSLEMLLPFKQHEYTFALAGTARMDQRLVVLLDYRSKNPGPIAVKAHEDREDCFQVDMPGRTRGRVWLDPDTFDVLRLDERLTGLVDVRLPPSKRQRGNLDVVFERLDSTTVYKAVRFADPDETLMLPASSESISVIRNSGIPRQRTTQRFTDYRRFVTEGRIVQDR